MEGFHPSGLDELLELEKQGLRSVLLLPLGQRDEINDWLLKRPKVKQSPTRFLYMLTKQDYFSISGILHRASVMPLE